MPLKPLEWPEPCTGPHELMAHDHGWWAGISDAKLRAKRECSERWRCRRCWLWFPGEACKPSARAALRVSHSLTREHQNAPHG